MGYDKPLPSPDPETRPFWDGCREGVLLIQKCSDCGEVRFPPTSYCPHCRSGAFDWIRASGRGRVFSWIVVRHPVPKEVYAGDVPYVVALVTLDEGVRMVANIRGLEPEDVAADMRVEAMFDAVTPEITLPFFIPAAGSAGGE